MMIARRLQTGRNTLAMAFALLGASSAVAPLALAQPAAELDEIVVTAQKREQRSAYHQRRYRRKMAADNRLIIGVERGNASDTQSGAGHSGESSRAGLAEL